MPLRKLVTRVSGRELQMLWAALGILWLGGVITGLWWVASYDNRPGVAASASTRWPSDSHMVPDPSRPTLVVLAHPRCDCTEASMAELAELIARAHLRPKTYVVFIKPGTVADGWERTTLWQTAAHIPDVSVIRDDDGLEARRFGAETSGQVVLYDANGLLLFSGGITGSRGHAGDNAGRATILALLNRETPNRTATPVFGCPLFAPAAPDRAKEPTRHASQHN
jgi:hypothetical protein